MAGGSLTGLRGLVFVPLQRSLAVDTLECITTRRSIRKFEQQRIARGTVEQLIDSARWSPSYNNSKVVRYTVLDDPQRIRDEAVDLMARENRHIVANAPLLLAVSVVTGRSGRRRDGSFETAKGDTWEMFDAGAACQTLCLAAASLGLGTVIMATFDEEAATRFFNLPDTERIIALVAAGLPAETPAAPRRKEVHEILRFMGAGR